MGIINDPALNFLISNASFFHSTQFDFMRIILLSFIQGLIFIIAISLVISLSRRMPIVNRNNPMLHYYEREPLITSAIICAIVVVVHVSLEPYLSLGIKNKMRLIGPIASRNIMFERIKESGVDIIEASEAVDKFTHRSSYVILP